MTLTLSSARDTMFAHALDAVNATIPISWPDQPFEMPVTGGWCRVTIHHADGYQSTLAGSTPVKRWTRVGTLSIGFFYPIGDNQQSAYDFGQQLLSHFAKIRNSQVFYRNIRVIEQPDDGSYQNFQFTASFEYDDAQ